jgi:hypothetical protein
MTSAWSRKALVVCAAAILGSCGSQDATSSSLAVPSLAVSGAARATGGCPSTHCIIVGSGPRFGKGGGNLLFYSQRAEENSPPTREIGGSKAHLGDFGGIASDSHGSLYAVNVSASAIEVFAADAQGNVAPIRTIAGSKTLLSQPVGIAIDGTNHVYVVNQKPARITVFAPDANGDTAPVRVISGKGRTSTIPGARHSIRAGTSTRQTGRASRSMLQARAATLNRYGKSSAPIRSFQRPTASRSMTSAMSTSRSNPGASR